MKPEIYWTASLAMDVAQIHAIQNKIGSCHVTEVGQVFLIQIISLF